MARRRKKDRSDELLAELAFFDTTTRRGRHRLVTLIGVLTCVGMFTGFVIDVPRSLEHALAKYAELTPSQTQLWLTCLLAFAGFGIGVLIWQTIAKRTRDHR